ncbi:MAG: sulfopyruvate decarboxylase subunit alpha [Armatimonadota bacterium]
MDWQSEVAQALKQNAVDVVAYVPDEVTGGLLALLEADPAITMVSVTREEEGVAVLAGAYLGGKRGVLIIQGSGLGNALNALSSLAIASQIPMLLIISERGRLGEFNPAQVPLGRATPRILEALGIQAFSIGAGDDVARTVDGSARLAFSSSLPVALLFSPTLTGGKTLR